jgi:hypothetical protein
VILAYFRPSVRLPFLLFVQALLSIFPESLHVGDGAGDSDAIVTAEVFEIGVGGG